VKLSSFTTQEARSGRDEAKADRSELENESNDENAFEQRLIVVTRLSATGSSQTAMTAGRRNAQHSHRPWTAELGLVEVQTSKDDLTIAPRRYILHLHSARQAHPH
jgi:hypothetical protein